MEKQGMKLRSGAVEYGRIYEQRIAAYLAIKCALSPDVADFWMLSNIDGFEAFDDIVLMVQDQAARRKLLCIQLKHLENKTLQAMQLEQKEQKKTKFGLTKYQESFEVIENNIAANKIRILKNISIDQVHLILWTNAALTGTEKLQSIKIENVNEMGFFNTSESNVYRISNLPSSESTYKEEFLERFYLFAKQASATSLDKMIKEELSSHITNINNSVIIAITDYFAKWSMGDKGTIKKITKRDVQMVLLEFLLVPHLIEPSQLKETSPEKMSLINETFTKFNVVPVKDMNLLQNVFNSNKASLEKLYGSDLNLNSPWNIDLSATHWEALKLVANDTHQRILKILQEKEMFVPHLTVKDIYLAAWQCHVIPMVINCDITECFIENILVKFKDIAKHLSLVLLNPILSSLDDNFEIFSDITAIKDDSLKSRNMTQTFVSLQGKEKIKMDTFKDNIAVLQEITPDVYLMLIEDVLTIGEVIEVESYYVKRDIRRPILNVSVLNENSISKDRQNKFNQAGDIFILVEFQGTLPFRYRNNSMDLTQYIKDLNRKDNEQIYILFTNFKNVEAAVTYLHEDSEKSVHVLKLGGDSLEWLYSKGTVETLQDYWIETNLLKDENPEQNIPEDDILINTKSDINIISNNAGMGKTFMLKSIANKFKPEEWVCYINLSEHVTKLSGEADTESSVNFLFKCLKKEQPSIQNLASEIYSHCVQTKKIIYLFDGYDEVSSYYVLQFLKRAMNQGLRMWITTRPTYKKELEISMENLSFEITHFSSEDHVTFLWKYFRSHQHIYHYEDTQIQYIIDTINKCSENLDKTFIAVPLQTRMFAEIFGDDINQISAKESMTIVDLYNKFVDVKLKEYKSYEATSLRKTLSKLALKLFFTEKLLENVVDFEDLAEEAKTFQESYKKDSIVIGLNEKGDAVFGHRTFAEFLAAYWLAKNIVNRKREFNLSWIPMIEKLYFIEMMPVRVFFDRILSQNLFLHIAVLNNDIENVRTLLKAGTFEKEVDALGRSALHLAVTYGTYYDLYFARDIDGLREIGLHSVAQSNKKGFRLRIPLLEEKQYRISNEIVDEFLQNGYTNKTDLLFRYDLFDYAMKSCSLNFVNSLYKWFEKTTLYFDYRYHFEIFLYCIIHDNLHNILSTRKTYTFDNPSTESRVRPMFMGYHFKLLRTKFNDLYLTEVAALVGAKETLFDLLHSDALQLEHGNLLHKACFNGHTEIVLLLHRMGADINKLDDSDWSPLYQAGKRNRADIIYHFLKDAKFLSSANSSGTMMTPLHYAVQGGHLDCVEALLELGAKVNVEDQYGNIPLIYACKYGHPKIIEAILKSGLVDISDCTVKASVNIAAFHGNADSIKTLLEIGLDGNNLDEEGNTPLVIASKKGFSNVVLELNNSGKCDINMMVHNESLSSLQMWCAGNNHILLHTKLFLIDCDRRKIGGITALHFAARHGHADCTRTLLDCSANQHLEDVVTKYTPLVWACMYGTENVLIVLLSKSGHLEKTRNEVEIGLIWASLLGHERCIEVLCRFIEEAKVEFTLNKDTEQRIKDITKAEFGIDLWYLRENENLPLLLAAKNGCTGVVKNLLSRNYRNNDGLEESLHWAARNGHLDCVKELILAGADDTRTNEKHLRLLPIAWACMYGKTNVVEYLLENKTSEYLKNKDLHLAVNWAAMGGFNDCLKLLLNFGLDVDNYYEDLGGTPLIIACYYRGTEEVIDTLMAHNCKVDTRNSEGLTALDFAARKKNFGIVKRFINCEAFKGTKIGEGTELYNNLVLALKWALEKEENEMIEKLLGLGIGLKECE